MSSVVRSTTPGDSLASESQREASPWRHALSQIAHRALSLDDRLSRVGGAREENPDASAAETLELWIRAACAGDRDLFRRRLEWDGLCERDVLSALSADPDNEAPASEPSWTELLDSALSRCGSVREELRAFPGALPEFDGLENACRFRELWVPFAREGRQRLLAVERTMERIDPATIDRLQGELLTDLCAISELAVFDRFCSFRRQSLEAGELGIGEPPAQTGEDSTRLYSSFISGMLEERLLPFFQEFSTLARQVCVLVSTWVAAHQELLGRLAEDRPLLEARWGCLGSVKTISRALSDRHHGGRSVRSIEFESGVTIIYKPRTVALEAAYNGFLEWLASRNAPHTPRSIPIIDRESYGWTGFVEQRPARDQEEVEAYVERAGALLCVADILGGKDLQMDNVVAAQGGPVIIDSESILQPMVRRRSDAGQQRTALEKAKERVSDSFARTGLLSFLQLDAAGRVCDIGGFNGTGGYVAMARGRQWKGSNTDAMRLEFGAISAPPARNVLFRDGRPVAPEDHGDALARGFEGIYHFFLENRDELTSPSGPLEPLWSQPTRVIFRPSNQYAAVLHGLANPSCQREGFRGGFFIDSLNRVFCGEKERPLLWPLVVDERASLEALDIPHFLIPADSTMLCSSRGERIDDYFAHSGKETLRRRLKSLGPEDLDEQLAVLTGILLHPSDPGSRVEAAVAWPSRSAFSVGDFVGGAQAIAKELRRKAIVGEEGAITWIAPAYLRGGDRQDHGVSYYLYDGASGIALFFAALARVTGRADHAESARAACLPIAAVLDSRQSHELMAREGIGACSGLGSLVYALTTAGSLLSDAWYVELAERVAAHMDGDRLSRDQRLDVEGGAAGAILALLNLYQVTGNEEYREKAVESGRHLISHAVAAGSDGCAWSNDEGLMLAGFAHGAAGIALALSRLSEATGDPDFQAIALAACRYERNLFSPEAANWPTLQRSGPPVFLKAWCHGAPGIALARSGMLENLDDDLLRADLEAGLRTTRDEGLGSIDHLCCGNFGRLEVLLEIGQRSGRPELVTEARERGATVLDRARAAGQFRLRSSDRENLSFQPGFFRGLAGIGYELLRLAAPESLPSILLFEGGSPSTPRRDQETHQGAEIQAVSAATDGDRYELLRPGQAAEFSSMTFPAYRHLLSLDPAPRHLDVPEGGVVIPVGVVAWRGADPAGLALAEIPRGSKTSPEVLSLFVQSADRRSGIGTELLRLLEQELLRRGADLVTGTYMTGQPGTPSLEKVLQKSGWDPPITRMLTIRFTLEEARRTKWYGKYPLGRGYEVFPWVELTLSEREELRRSQQERAWIPPDLEPWKFDARGYEPISSLGVRREGEIVGWVINHRISDRIVRFTCSFIRKDLGRRGRLVPVYSESIRRLSLTAFEECTLTVPVHHPGMAGFLRRWCGPWANFFAETVGTQKRLRDDGAS